MLCSGTDVTAQGFVTFVSLLRSVRSDTSLKLLWKVVSVWQWKTSAFPFSPLYHSMTMYDLHRQSNDHDCLFAKRIWARIRVKLICHLCSHSSSLKLTLGQSSAMWPEIYIMEFFKIIQQHLNNLTCLRAHTLRWLIDNHIFFWWRGIPVSDWVTIAVSTVMRSECNWTSTVVLMQYVKEVKEWTFLLCNNMSSGIQSYRLCFVW